MIVKGRVTKITNFGVFVELEPDLEGLLHVSELADQKVDDPHSVVKIGDEIEVKILRVDVNDRKIGLSKKRAEWAAATEEGDESHRAGGRIRPRRGGLHVPGAQGAGVLDETMFFKPASPKDDTEAETEQQPESAGE
jgi:small subunit ribosomal protein S1